MISWDPIRRIMINVYQVVGACLMACFLPLLNAHSQVSAPSADKVAVLGIVRDGPSQHFAPHYGRIKAQLHRFVKGDYVIRDVEFMGDYTREGITKQLLRALEDQDIEIVFTGGLIATQLASTLPATLKTKPIFGGFPHLAERVDRPGSPLDSSNYTYISIPDKIKDDLIWLKTLSKQDEIYLILDKAYVASLENLPLVVENLESKIPNLKLHLIQVLDSAQEALAAIPKNGSSVYVTTLPRFHSDELKKLYQSLTQRGMITFSMEGQQGLDDGAMAAMVGGNDIENEMSSSDTSVEESDPVIRRTAINMHHLFLGLDPADLEVHLPSQEFLRINIQTADKIPWSASYETYLVADFMGVESRRAGASLALDEAMRLAEQQHPDFEIARQDVEIARAERGISRSSLRPTLTLNAVNNRSEIKNPIATQLWDSLSAGTYGVQITQILFNDELRSQLRAAGFQIEAEEHEASSIRLDVKAAAARAFLNALLASSLFEIQKEDLRRSRSNLRLAQLRQEIGAAEPREVFRWQSARDQSRAALVQQEAQMDIAMYALNQALNVDRHTSWNLEDIQVDTKKFHFMDETLTEYIKTEKQFDLLVRFFQSQSILQSPELMAFDRILESQGILYRQKKRAYYVPQISLNGGVQRYEQKTNLFDQDGQNEFSGGINFSFPLFQGGLRKSVIQRQKALIRKVEAQRESAVLQLELNALSAIHQMAASHANIILSRSARDAARKNYDSIVEKYFQGAANILELLDAQSGYIQQKSAAVMANYEYLKRVVNLQRAIAWFEHEKSDGEQKLMHNALRQHLSHSLKSSQ